jgi:hypothetical protein
MVILVVQARIKQCNSITHVRLDIGVKQKLHPKINFLVFA